MFYYLNITKAKIIAKVMPTKSANKAAFNVWRHLVILIEEKYNAIT